MCQINEQKSDNRSRHLAWFDSIAKLFFSKLIPFNVLFKYYCNFFVILYIHKQMQDLKMSWEI